jgi:hypothetical protein
MCTPRGLDSGERIQVRFAAALFGWMQHSVVARQGRREMGRFLEALALPLQSLPDPADGPEAALARMCESDAGVRLRLGQALRHAPLYLELSAHALPHFTTAARYRHAAWLYLMPEPARRLAAQHLGAVRCPPQTAAELLEMLERRMADQAAATQAGTPQAA